MVNTRRSESGNKQDNNVPGGANAEGNQQLITVTLRNLSQLLVTQAQLMQQLMQQMNNNNAFSATAPTTQERRYCTKCSKRKMVDQGQHEARNFKTRGIQPQSNHVPTTTTLKTSGSTPLPPTQISLDNNGGQSQRNKTSRVGIQCFNCQDMGHYANKCPKKKQAANPPNTEVPKVNIIQANKKPQNSGKGRLYNVTAQAPSDEEYNADDDNSS